MAIASPGLDLPRGVRGASAVWDMGELAGDILAGEFFPASAPAAIYRGAIGEAARYLGSRTEAQLYLGAGNLWP